MAAPAAPLMLLLLLLAGAPAPVWGFQASVGAAAKRLIDAPEVMPPPVTAEVMPPSITAEDVLLDRAQGWLSGALDDWPSACFATSNFTRSLSCECSGGPPQKAHLEHLLGRSGLLGKVAYRSVLGRTKALDEVITQLGAFDQVVFLAAGYDTRAYRMRSEFGNVSTIFETDQAGTLASKVQLVGACGLQPVNGEGGVQYLGVDLLEAQPFSTLQAHPRFKAGARTLFISEHVAEYFTQAENDRWIRALSAFAAGLAGEAVFVLMALRMPSGTSGLPYLTVSDTGETWKFYMPFFERNADSWMAQRGWHPYEGLEGLTAKFLGEYGTQYLGVFRPEAEAA